MKQTFRILVELFKVNLLSKTSFDSEIIFSKI